MAMCCQLPLCNPVTKTLGIYIYIYIYRNRSKKKHKCSRYLSLPTREREGPKPTRVGESVSRQSSETKPYRVRHATTCREGGTPYKKGRGRERERVEPRPASVGAPYKPSASAPASASPKPSPSSAPFSRERTPPATAERTGSETPISDSPNNQSSLALQPRPRLPLRSSGNVRDPSPALS
jgi:hypothetical protein